ncbi:hypothetical protein [Pelagibius sp.]|uniref:hypothetical protein n=1 Tax=Pelagibius sp. TaxID=1931238 RepID=UPI001A13FC51|nr:hypothetical protein [Pelagibius sp.]HIP77384.1 histidine kinase [Kiloniellaceae bacterium]
MSKHLVSADNPNGQRSEELLAEIRAEILSRMAAYAEDPRPEAKTVLENNLEIAQLLTDAIHLAEVNSQTLAEDL